MDSIQDPKNIVGVSSLIDNDDINSAIDLGKIEQEIIQGAKVEALNGSVDHAAEYAKEMERITQTLNMPQVSRHSAFDVDDGDGSDEDDGDGRSVVSRQSKAPSRKYDEPIREERVCDYNDRGGDWQSNRGASFADPHMRIMTQEERKQSHINRVLGDIDDKELEGINKERDEDTKASLLEQIDMLRTTLDDDGIDIKGVPIVEKNHSIVDIQNVYKILRLKNDRNRYCSFAEELILAGAYGLESLFDGEKVWFGSYRPDLVGWSSTVKVKLRRMRYETSTFVGEIMQEYQMSAGVRLMLEIAPSLFLYSRSKKISNNDNLAGDSGYKDAINQLNSLR